MPMVILICIGVLLRLIPHIPNIAPISAIALFSSVYMKKWQSLIITCLTMLISDYLLLYIQLFPSISLSFRTLYPPLLLFHATTIYVYISFFISTVLGVLLKGKITSFRVVSVSFISSLQFYLLTNFGVWASTTMYPHTLSGLLQCYILAIPFFHWTVLGDIGFSGALFGGYEILSRIMPYFSKRHLSHSRVY